jgi:hypothetical protein
MKGPHTLRERLPSCPASRAWAACTHTIVHSVADTCRLLMQRCTNRCVCLSPITCQACLTCHGIHGAALRRWEKRQIFERLDELKEQIEAATAIICKGLLDSADVVGVTCTGAAGPELQHFAFDMVVIDEGSQASE